MTILPYEQGDQEFYLEIAKYPISIKYRFDSIRHTFQKQAITIF
jgi:hypothetical protein